MAALKLAWAQVMWSKCGLLTNYLKTLSTCIDTQRVGLVLVNIVSYNKFTLVFISVATFCLIYKFLLQTVRTISTSRKFAGPPKCGPVCCSTPLMRSCLGLVLGCMVITPDSNTDTPVHLCTWIDCSPLSSIRRWSAMDITWHNITNPSSLYVSLWLVLRLCVCLSVCLSVSLSLSVSCCHAICIRYWWYIFVTLNVHRVYM